MNFHRQLHLYQIFNLVLVVLLLTACRPTSPVVGLWQSDEPASLQFEYLADGTVIMKEDTREFIVFHYEITDEDSLQLYDGMGRLQKYNFRISDDALTFYDITTGDVIHQFHRVE